MWYGGGMGLADQLEEATQEAQYVVRWVTKVDHPEKRDASYKVRDKVSVGSNRATFKTKEAALGRAKDLVNGDEDFASEFTSKVEVYQVLANGRTRQIMKMVERERGEDGKIRSV
jgi:hypothetical protein